MGGELCCPRSLKEWIRLVGALEELNVFWLEDFLHPENYRGYAEVAEHTTTCVYGAVSKPVRQVAGLASGLKEGVSSFLSGKAKEN